MTQTADELLASWASDGLEQVTLPSGRAVKVRPGSLMDLAIADLLPAPLLAAVVGSQGGGGDDAGNGIEMIRASIAVAAEAVRAIQAQDGTWVPVRIDVATFLSLPTGDREAISRIALGPQFGEVASGLARFRDDTEGAAPGEDGGDVRPAAVSDAGRSRAARRARPRSGTGA